jgi:hypothetical protein
MRVGLSIMVTSLVVAMSVGCTQDRVTAPVTADQAKVEQGSVRQQAAPPGSGLVLDSITGVSVPLIGHLGNVNINPAVITIDLGPIDVDVLGLATVDVPAATLTGRSSGALGSLLCNLGSALSGITSGAAGLVQAINNLI